MDNNRQRYQLTQDGKSFILTSEIKDNLLRLSCIEINKEDPPIYFSEFSLSDLRELNKLFDKSLTIREAQDLINKTLNKEKVKIELDNNQINIYLFLLNQTTLFSLQPNIHESNAEITYSPKRYLPVRKIFYPPVYIKRPTIYINEEEKSYNDIIQENTSQIASPTTNSKLSLILTPRKTKQNIQYSSYNNNVVNSPVNEFKAASFISENEETQKIGQLQQEIKRIKIEYDLQKNQTIKLNEELESLKKQILILNKKNEELLKKNSEIFTEENSQIILLRQQNEKLSEELKQLLSKNKMLENEKNKYFLQNKELSEINYKLQSQIQNFSQIYTKYTKINSIPNIIKGEIIENNNELNLLTNKICPEENRKIQLNLLYKASVDSDKAEAFHKKCDNAESTLVLVKSKNGKRFGGFTACSWKGNCENKKDPKAFVFSLDKMEIYENIPEEEAIGCYPEYGPVFLGCQIRIYDDAFEKGGTTFEKGLNFNTKEDYELSGGLKEFQIEEIEVYEVKLD